MCASLHRGEPVVVSGRLCQRTYEVDETVKVAYEIAATSVGHDLSRGRTEFTKAWTPSPATTVSADSDGLPADESALWHDTLSDDEPGADEAGGSGAALSEDVGRSEAPVFDSGPLVPVG